FDLRAYPRRWQRRTFLAGEQASASEATPAPRLGQNFTGRDFGASRWAYPARADSDSYQCGTGTRSSKVARRFSKGENRGRAGQTRKRRGNRNRNRVG